MSGDAREFARIADAAAASVAGVTRLYPASNAIARAVRPGAPLSEVTATADGARVRVSIGVSGAPAEVGAAVADAVRASLREHGDIEVTVRVARATAG